MIRAGDRMFCEIFDKNVEIVSVYKHTVTVRASTSTGVHSDAFQTFRGIRISSLSPRRPLDGATATVSTPNTTSVSRDPLDVEIR